MHQVPLLYNLYCINVHCEQSIHLGAMQTQAIFDVDNLTASHICTCCRHELFSAMDIEIEYMIAKAGMRIQHRSYFNSAQ